MIAEEAGHVLEVAVVAKDTGGAVSITGGTMCLLSNFHFR
jgi:hypothetical protein